MSASQSPRTLLITGTAPGEPGVGGVILKDLVQIAGTESFHCCWLTPHRSEPPRYVHDLNTSFFPRRYETGWRPVPGLLGEVASRAATQVLAPSHLKGIIRSVQRKITEFRPDQILCVLESASAVRVTRALLESFKVPLLTIVWDDIHTVCPEEVLDRWTRRTLYREFGDVLKASQKIAVICENMSEAYEQEFGVRCFVLRHGMSEAVNQDETTQYSEQGAIRIGFAGSITAPDCMQSFIAALDGCGWTIAGREVCLRMLGSRYQLGSRCRQWIEYLGWRDVHETRDLLNECQLLYLPQAFSPKLKHLTELSFPTKLSTYISTSVPVLLQSPDYGSLSRFWKSYELGPRVDSLEAGELLSAVNRVLNASESQRDRWETNRQAARKDALSEEVFRQGVFQLLGVSPNIPCHV